MEALKGLYHADKLDEKTFIENFTIRLKEFKLIMETLERQDRKPLQHFLVTGKRGMGKSTLLRRIYLEAKSPGLSRKMLSVYLGSEQYRLSRLFKLWEIVIEQLGKKEPKLIEEKIRMEASKDYEKNLLHIIVDYLATTGKTLLLLIDNFDQFVEKISKPEQHTLRETLIQYPIQIIGNTIFYNEHFAEYKNPFFDFFRPIQLNNLDREEAEDFIRLRASLEGYNDFEEIFEKNKGKIDALRILSGGVPRTLLILLGIVLKNQMSDAVEYLHEMVEQVTPLYQDRMKALSSQQQEIMHHLAMHWDRVPVKEIADEMRIPSKSISAQLVQLEKRGYIKKIDIPGRNHYYEIDERFFNIWLLMSEAGPYDSKRVIWLTKWLDAYYSHEELKDFAGDCKKTLKNAKPGNRFFMVQALAESEKLAKRYKRELVEGTLKDLQGQITEIDKWAGDFNHKIEQEERMLYEEINELLNKKNWKSVWDKIEILEAINLPVAKYAKAEFYCQTGEFSMAEKLLAELISDGSRIAMHRLAILYENEKKDIAKAEQYYLMAIEGGDTDAMYNLALLYEDERDITKAEYYYLMAIGKGDVKAMFNLALLYKNEKKDIAKAEHYYLMAIGKGDVEAMNNLALLYEDERDFAKAEHYYLMAIGKEDVNAMYNLALLYEVEKKDFAKAEHYYLMAVGKGDVKAMFNLALLYKNEKKDIAKAEHYYLMAIGKEDVKAMYNLALLYKNEKKDIAKAEHYYLMAIGKGSISAMNNLAVLYKNEKKDIAKAEHYYLMAIENEDVDAMYNLALLYEDEKKDIDKAEKFYLLAAEKNDFESCVSLASLYLSLRKESKKAMALQFSEKAIKLSSATNVLALSIHISVLLWNEKIKEAQEQLDKILENDFKKEGDILNITDALTYFLIFRQKQYLYKVFKTRLHLKDVFKPVYYALLHEMQEERLKEYLKMTDELREPVQQLVETIKKEQEKFGV